MAAAAGSCRAVSRAMSPPPGAWVNRLGSGRGTVCTRRWRRRGGEEDRDLLHDDRTFMASPTFSSAISNRPSQHPRPTHSGQGKSQSDHPGHRGRRNPRPGDHHRRRPRNRTRSRQHHGEVRPQHRLRDGEPHQARQPEVRRRPAPRQARHLHGHGDRPRCLRTSVSRGARDTEVRLGLLDRLDLEQALLEVGLSAIPVGQRTEEDVLPASSVRASSSAMPRRRGSRSTALHWRPRMRAADHGRPGPF